MERWKCRLATARHPWTFLPAPTSSNDNIKQHISTRFSSIFNFLSIVSLCTHLSFCLAAACSISSAASISAGSGTAGLFRGAAVRNSNLVILVVFSKIRQRLPWRRSHCLVSLMFWRSYCNWCCVRLQVGSIGSVWLGLCFGMAQFCLLICICLSMLLLVLLRVSHSRRVLLRL